MKETRLTILYIDPFPGDVALNQLQQITAEDVHEDVLHAVVGEVEDAGGRVERAVTVSN